VEVDGSESRPYHTIDVSKATAPTSVAVATAPVIIFARFIARAF
jgi:hypothetical protein